MAPERREYKPYPKRSFQLSTRVPIPRVEQLTAFAHHLSCTALFLSISPCGISLNYFSGLSTDSNNQAPPYNWEKAAKRISFIPLLESVVSPAAI